MTCSDGMQVQKSWTYLEGIFGTSAEDIRRQLPAGSALFEAVHTAFKQAMAGMFASRSSAVQVNSLHVKQAMSALELWHPFALARHILVCVIATVSLSQACTQDGLLASLAAMAADLERVQGALHGYLDVKRSAFARFYFLAADDLLEVLGPSKDPQSVQPHLTKCFEGEQRLPLL